MEKMTWQSIWELANKFLVHARHGEEYYDFALLHAWRVFNCLPVKTLSDSSGTPTTPYYLFYGRKPSISKFRVLFSPCIFKAYQRTESFWSIDANKQKYKRILDSKTCPQRGICGIFVGFPPRQSGYLIFIPQTRTFVISADVVFDETFSSTLSLPFAPYRNAQPIQPLGTTLDETIP